MLSLVYSPRRARPTVLRSGGGEMSDKLTVMQVFEATADKH